MLKAPIKAIRNGDKMASEKPTVKKRNEEQYYEPIKDCLRIVLSKYLDPTKQVFQNALMEDMPKRVFLETVGGKNVFSEDLKKAFDDDTLHIIRDEGIYPDLVGFVQRTRRVLRK
jgi:hypothetical protein